MSLSHYALANSINEAAAYFAAAKELDAAYYTQDQILKMRKDFEPSNEFSLAAVAFYNKISSVIADALGFPGDAAEYEDFDAWEAAQDNLNGRSGWKHRIANIINNARKNNDGGHGDDNEWRLIMKAINPELEA